MWENKVAHATTIFQNENCYDGVLAWNTALGPVNRCVACLLDCYSDLMPC